MSEIKKLSFKKIIKISRPWNYIFLVGPYIFGVLMAIDHIGDFFSSPIILLFLLFFTLPANLLLYGLDDIYDREIDKKLPEKRAEDLVKTNEQHFLFLSIFFLVLPLALYAFANFDTIQNIILLTFILLAVFFSVPPIRAKRRAFLDAVCSILFILPALLGFLIARGVFLPMTLVVALFFWIIGVFIINKIIFLERDKRLHIKTIATYLGEKYALGFAFFMFLNAFIIAIFTKVVVSKYIFILSAVIYITLLYLISRPIERKKKQEVFYITNTSFVLFWIIFAFLKIIV